MALLGTDFDDIDVPLIEELARARIVESIEHDYKREIPAIKHLAELVAAFANTGGGVIVLGFDEKDWTIPGVRDWNEDKDVLSLTPQLNSAIDPLVSGLRWRTLARDGAPPVVLLGVPQSLSAPHSIASARAFYLREPRGKRPMTTAEIRRAFLQGATWTRDLEVYRMERHQRTRSMPGLDHEGGLLLLHLLPLGRLDQRIDVTKSSLPMRQHFDSVGQAIVRPNIDGYTIQFPNGTRPLQYVTAMMNGGIEACWRLRDLDVHGTVPSAGHIDGRRMTERVHEMMLTGFEWAQGLRVAAPMALMLTASSVNGRRLALSRASEPIRQQMGFDRELVLVPPSLVTSLDATALAIKQQLDSLWLAAEWNDCPHMNADGVLKPF